MLRALLSSSLLAAVALAQQAPPPAAVPLWPDGAPGALGDEPKDRPNVRVHVPSGDPNARHPAIVVCPGGGYGGLAMGHEGAQIAEWLGSIGVAAVVLDYRHRGKGYGHPAPLDDARRALRLVRARADEWRIDPTRVGVLGFSAGGHLAASVSTWHDAGAADAADPVERRSCRPDFAVLCYPVIAFDRPFTHRGSQKNLLGDGAPPELVLRLSCERQVAADTPPTFLWHTADDAGVPVQNSLAYAEALRAHGVPVELHVFEHGRHGLGLAEGTDAEPWPELCRKWLVQRGVLPARDDDAARRFDLVLRGGTLLDPEALTTTPGDLGVRDGHIAALGAFDVAAGTPTIELAGAVVAPGFVDLHTHVDTEVVRAPLCPNFLRMGVTTILTGNCGGSVEDLEHHFARLDKGGVGPNYASLVGLGTVRRQVLGTANRAPTTDELQRMQQLVEAGMRAGAFGVSTGLIYVPGIYASRDELTALTAAVARHGGLYVSHMRHEDDLILDAIDEALAIGRGAGVPVHISHIKCSTPKNHGRAAEVLAHLQAARASGIRVTADQYAYDASSTGLDVLFPAAALDVGREAFAKKLSDDDAFRADMHRALLGTMDEVGFGDFRYARIASAKGNEALNGLLIPEAAQRLLGAQDRDAQAETAMRLFVAAAPDRVGMVYHKMAEADVETFLQEPWIAVASDAGLRADDSPTRPHPRGSGNNPRVLGRYVRERHVLDLPRAIAKMTVVPARVIGLADRGRLAVGQWADLVVFDPATVADRATYAEPTLRPEGISLVLVNGQVAVRDNQLTGVRAGRVLRHGR
ncbi:MAG: amidohydrolase family protein [Planctomycetes bacterium]|nr:amidohydrolase family protein [Planctomycetota bacterium]